MKSIHKFMINKKTKPVLLLTSLTTLLFSLSCTPDKHQKFLEQLKNNLPTYDSITLNLISKYSTYYKAAGVTDIYPSNESKMINDSKLYDSSLRDFCNKNEIRFIKILNGNEGKVLVVYFLYDKKSSYIFNKEELTNNVPFENDNVKTIPINKHWRLDYKKSD